MVKKVHHTPSARLGTLRKVEMHGFRKARSGNKNWMYIGTALWTLRTVRRLAEHREELLISEQLKPGERIIISNARPTLDEPPVAAAPKGRRARKAQRKAEARQAKIDAKAAAKAAKKQARRSRRGKTPASV